MALGGSTATAVRKPVPGQPQPQPQPAYQPPAYQPPPQPAAAPAPAPAPVDTSKTTGAAAADRPQAFPYYSSTGKLLGYRLGSADSSRVITPQQYAENYQGAAPQTARLGGAGSPILSGGGSGGATFGLPGGGSGPAGFGDPFAGIGIGGGGVGGGATSSFDPLSIEAKPSPDMAAARSTWEGRMGDIKTGLDARMSDDNSKQATDQALAKIRSQAAGASEGATAAGAATGRGPGAGAAGIGDAATAAGGRAATDIALAQQNRKDALFTSGEGLQNQAYAMNPFAETANLGLAQQNLGLQSYLGQLNAQNQQAQTAAQIAEARARIYGSPSQWYSQLISML